MIVPVRTKDKLKDSFSIFMPAIVKKSTDGDNSNDENFYTIQGFASTATKDFEGEIIDPAGIDDSYFVENGWIDYEHDKENVIGIPTENCFTDPQKGLYVEAHLFKGNPDVEKTMQLERNLKSVGSDRKIGFSIEGQIAERDSNDPTIIRRVQITGVAVTTNPANPEATWEVAQKSRFGAIDKSTAPLVAGYGITPETQIDGEALRPEALAGHITSLAYAIGKMSSPKELHELGQAVAGKLNSRASKNSEVEPLFLQVFSGISRKQAKDILSQGDKS